MPDSIDLQNANMSTGNGSYNGLFNAKNPNVGASMLKTLLMGGLQTGLLLYGSDPKNPYGKGDAITNGVLNTASQLPGVAGMIGTGLSVANQLFAKNVKQDNTAIDLLSKSNAFTGTRSILGDHEQKIGNFNSAGFLGQLFTSKKNKKDALVQDQNFLKYKLKIGDSILQKGNATKSNLLSNEIAGQRTNLIDNGFTGYNLQFGKKGMLFENTNNDVEYYKRVNRRNVLKQINDLYNLNKSLFKKINTIKKSLEAKPIEIKKEGGAINIIVDGALHAHKHTLKTTTEFKNADITEKGVPVVVMEEGGNVVQQLEVERDEIILHYELTKKMEELANSGNEEDMITAGKILLKEILKNTKDNKNKLLKTVE